MGGSFLSVVNKYHMGMFHSLWEGWVWKRVIKMFLVFSHKRLLLDLEWSIFALLKIESDLLWVMLILKNKAYLMFLKN